MTDEKDILKKGGVSAVNNFRYNAGDHRRLLRSALFGRKVGAYTPCGNYTAQYFISDLALHLSGGAAFYSFSLFAARKKYRKAADSRSDIRNNMYSLLLYAYYGQLSFAASRKH